MTSESKAIDLRSEVDRLISAGPISVESAALVSRRLADLWRAEAGSVAAAFLVSRFEKLRGKLPLQPYRLAILRSFTVEPAIPLLRAEAFVHGIDLTVQLGDFNAYPQEILDSNSLLYRFAPDAVMQAGEGDEAAMRVCDQQRFKDSKRTAAEQRPSMGQDMQKGRRTEIEFLNGFVVREGEKLGRACRANAVLTDIVKRVERHELSPDPRHITELRLN